MVPFEPKEGRPVYCKECMFKIKSGELKPETGFVASRSSRQEEKVSTSPLAALCIEFPVIDTNFRVSKNQGDNKIKPILTNRTENNNNRTNTNNNQSNNKHYEQNKQPYVKTEKKHGGPSPLLKGLLEKIGINNQKEISKNPEIKEVVKEVPVSMSLSSLKKPVEGEAKKEFIAPVKEASEEKKASLKDLLNRTMNHKLEQHKDEPKKDEVINNIKDELEIKNEEKEVIKEEIKEEDVTPAVQSVSQPEEVLQTKEEVTKEESSVDESWQKPKAKREVPEDVLRKVLE